MGTRTFRAAPAASIRYGSCNRYSMAKKRSSGRRDLVKSKRVASYAKRTAKGRFTERDIVKRSQPVDRRKKAERKVKSGYGDQGDR
jgi:hypothetical protein